MSFYSYVAYIILIEVRNSWWENTGNKLDFRKLELIVACLNGILNSWRTNEVALTKWLAARKHKKIKFCLNFLSNCE